MSRGAHVRANSRGSTERERGPGSQGGQAETAAMHAPQSQSACKATSCIAFTAQDENLLIPIHAYPIMNETKFPKRIDFGRVRSEGVTLTEGSRGRDITPAWSSPGAAHGSAPASATVNGRVTGCSGSEIDRNNTQIRSDLRRSVTYHISHDRDGACTHARHRAEQRTQRGRRSVMTMSCSSCCAVS